MRLHASATSLPGPVREENQDALRLSEPADAALHATHGHLYALADGMGGHASGWLASQMAIETLFKTFYQGRPHQPLANLKKAVTAANWEVHQAAQRLNVGRMGTTLTALNLVGPHLYVAHVGDARAYLVRDQQARCLTQDHTQVGELVRLKVLAPHLVRQHPRRSFLSQALGLDLFVQPDFAQFTVRADDRLVLCSDGVWSVLEDTEFAALLSTTPVAAASERLVNLALERGSDDNVSAIVLHIEQVAETASTQAGRWWQFWGPRKISGAEFTLSRGEP